MTVHIDVSNRQKLTWLVELLKSLDFVERVQVEETQLATDSQSTGNPSLFDRFYGSLQSGLTNDEIDNQLQTLRNEWDRPTW